MTLFELTLALAIASGTSILLVGLGEMMAEKVGVLNIGLEGIMLMGAASGFIVGVNTGNPVVALLAAMAVGGGFNLIFGTAAVALKADQIICTGSRLHGIGMSRENGASRRTGNRLRYVTWRVPGLSDIPVLGPIFFRQEWVVYIAFCLPFLAHFLLYHTRHGLNMRAIGDDPVAADAAGIPVVRWQMFYVLVCGDGGTGGAISAGDPALGLPAHSRPRMDRARHRLRSWVATDRTDLRGPPVRRVTRADQRGATRKGGTPPEFLDAPLPRDVSSCRRPRGLVLAAAGPQRCSGSPRNPLHPKLSKEEAAMHTTSKPKFRAS